MKVYELVEFDESDSAVIPIGVFTSEKKADSAYKAWREDDAEDSAECTLYEIRVNQTKQGKRLVKRY